MQRVWLWGGFDILPLQKGQAAAGERSFSSFLQQGEVALHEGTEDVEAELPIVGCHPTASAVPSPKVLSRTGL